MRELIGKTETGDGFASYMEKRAVGAPGSEHYEIPILGSGTPETSEDVDRIDLVIEGEAATHIEKVAQEQELENGGVLVNEALHFYLNMLEAEAKGFTNMVLVNPDTEEVIQLGIS